MKDFFGNPELLGDGGEHFVERKRLTIDCRYRIQHVRRGAIIGTVVRQGEVSVTVRPEVIRDGEIVTGGLIFVLYEDAEWSRLKETTAPKPKNVPKQSERFI